MITVIGCGWLGAALAQELLVNGRTVAGSARQLNALNALKENGLIPFALDLELAYSIPDEVCVGTRQLIITVPPFQRDTPTVYAARLSDLVAKFQHLEKVIFTSSTGIYPQRSGDYTEEFSFLEIEKSNNVLFQAEQALHKALGDRLIILRPAGLFGPGRHPVLHLAGNQNVPNPSGAVNLVHQKDVIRAIEVCLEHPKANGIYNLSFPDHPCRVNYYTKLYRQHNLPSIGFVTSTHIDRFVLGDKIVRELGFSYTHSIFEITDAL